MAFVYEINGQRVEFDKKPSEADIDEAASQLGGSQQSQGAGGSFEQDPREGKVIPQITKGLYESVPFGKRVVGMLPNAQQIEQNMATTPEPTNIQSMLGRGLSEAAPTLATMAPIIGAAGALVGPGILADVLGFGAYSGGRAALGSPVPSSRGEAIENTKEAIKQTAGGMGMGLLFGGMNKLGANLIPKQIPGAERIGGAVAGTVLGAITGGKKEALTFGVLGGMFPGMREAKRTQSELNTQLRSQTESKLAQVGVRPSPTEVKQGKTNKFYDKANGALQSIYEAKDQLKYVDDSGQVREGGLPQNAQEFAQAIPQVKKMVYDAYSQASQQATGRGVTVELFPITTRLLESVNEPRFLDQHPEIHEYALKLEQKLRERGAYTPEQAEAWIKDANQTLNNYYRSGNQEVGSKAYVDSFIATELRGSLDSAIENSTGIQYQTLKNKYGQLKELEKGANVVANKVKAQKPGSLIDFFNAYNMAEIGEGILTGNMGRVVGGMAKASFGAYIKGQRNPNNVINRLFKDVNKTYNHKTLNDRISDRYAVLEALTANMGERGSVTIPGGGRSAEAPFKPTPTEGKWYHGGAKGLEGDIVDGMVTRSKMEAQRYADEVGGSVYEVPNEAVIQAQANSVNADGQSLGKNFQNYGFIKSVKAGQKGWDAKLSTPTGEGQKVLKDLIRKAPKGKKPSGKITNTTAVRG